MTRVISVGNYKGGVGKSTATEVISYILATKYNYKVLVVDLDPQTDVTFKLKNTFEKVDAAPKVDMLTGLIEDRMKDTIVTLHPNLDLVHGTSDMEDFDKFIYQTQPPEAEVFYFQSVFPQIMKDYDFVLFDTRPSTAVTTKNAICISDYVIITTDTKESGSRSSQKVYEFIGNLVPHNPKIKLIGVLPYLVNSRGSTQQEVKQELDDAFEDDMFTHFIKDSQRVVMWGKYGIKENDMHDRNSMEMYTDIVEETLKRIEDLEV